ncbi:MAG: M23 family metallopeptidase [Gammaproteobacteria bacterium]|nr:M23 family metallopeptidase [Gammaproteobacteria bacterium]MCW8909336.1 M23 family metallopeptidase [Gammaproteobacteria bacterium]MCW9005485.1 M23 family metallopeptidase [Gammaproteobacteria bacterium]MCW9055258.1 M23 family metallopeptidase [Gammaproteobacteria bacterium]
MSKFRGRPYRIQVGSPMQLTLLATFVFIIATGVGVMGFWWGQTTQSSDRLAAIQKEVQLQRELIDQTKLNAQADLDALAARLGQIQAHATRLNALGQKLIKVAKIDPGEFNFTQSPGLGGPDEGDSSSNVQLDFGSEIDDVITELEDREQQLGVLETILMSSRMKEEVFPEGRPINRGWISSYYGMRTNPFTGKLQFHKGMDFAAKSGSEVLAVAGGVITWSGERYGYGNLVEVNHGNGYVTRYGHNKENLVDVGDTIKKGQEIARMGSTGRSTGPHVHFEVLKDGRQINPQRFVQSRH